MIHNKKINRQNKINNDKINNNKNNNDNYMNNNKYMNNHCETTLYNSSIYNNMCNSTDGGLINDFSIHDCASTLLEMFPKLTKKQAISLAKSGDDFSVIITRILDNNIESPVIDIKDIAVAKRGIQIIKKEYNYPEVFKDALGSRLMNLENVVRDLRKQAADLYEQAAALHTQPTPRTTQSLRAGCGLHYAMEADEMREKAAGLNKQAAMLLMREALEKRGPIDLHGLFVKEALAFIDDLYRYYNFKRILFCTGREFNSKTLRPAVEKWLKGHGFIVSDEGPYLCGYKRTPN